jgi:hypothetical protein
MMMKQDNGVELNLAVIKLTAKYFHRYSRALFDMDRHRDIVVVEENNREDRHVDREVVEYIEDHYRNEFDELLGRMTMEN